MSYLAERDAVSLGQTMSTIVNGGRNAFHRTGKTSLPRFEKFWREWRDTHGERLNSWLREWKQAQKDAVAKGFSGYPAQVTLPTWIAETYAARDFGEERHANTYIPFSLFANYRRTKTYWNLDVDLIASLHDLPWPEKTPASALWFVPHDSVVLNCGQYGDMVFFYDAYDVDPATKQSVPFDEARKQGIAKPMLCLRVAMFNSELGLVPLFALPLPEGATIDEAMQLGLSTIMPGKVTDYSRTRGMFKLLVNILLYASGCDDIVHEIGHRYPTGLKALKRKGEDLNDKQTKQDLSEPKEYAVGVRFGSAIRRYVDYREREEAEGDGSRTMRPHIRRAHPHLYWLGQKRERAVVRYLPPIPVNMQDAPQEINVATIQGVK